MFEEFYLVLFSGLDIEGSSFGNPAEWLTVIIGFISLYFTRRGFNYLKIQIDYQKDALNQQATQLVQQKEQFDFQVEQNKLQSEDEYFKQALGLIEVIYLRLSEILKSNYFIEIRHQTIFGDYTRLLDFESSVRSFKDYISRVDDDYETSKVQSFLISILNHSGIVRGISIKINDNQLLGMINCLAFDIIKAFGPFFVFFVTVDKTLINKSKYFDIGMGRFIIQSLIDSDEIGIMYILDDTLIKDDKIDDSCYVNFFDHPKFKELNDLYISLGLEPLTLPDNPS